MQNLIKYLTSLSFIFLLFPMSVIAEDKEIKEMRTVYIQDCKEEVSIAACECIFNYSIDAGYTKEDLLSSDLTFDYREINGIAATEVPDERFDKFLEIMFASMGACMSK